MTEKVDGAESRKKNIKSSDNRPANIPDKSSDNRSDKSPVVERIRKRDGRIAPYKREKIEKVLTLAAEASDESLPVVKLAMKVEKKLFKAYAKESGKQLPQVEDVQDLVEETLMENGHYRVARQFILYREQRAVERNTKSAMIGKQINTELSINALKLLRERYLLRNKERGWFESPEELFERVAKSVASAERRYGADEARERFWKNRFKRAMRNLDFLPNSPCMMNAGTSSQQFASSIAIPISDDLKGIYRALESAAKMQQVGAGTGFNFSSLRPKGARVKSIEGVASGPLTFLNLFSESAKTIKQAGRRQGGNLAILDVIHPDILDFITAKSNKGLENFNLSVLLSNEFLHAVIADKEYSLRAPRSRSVFSRMNAKQVFDLIVASAWNHADPGVIFKDALERDNPLPEHSFEATSSCAEFPLSKYEEGFICSLNLSRFVTASRTVDWRRLKEVVALAVRFLDDMIDTSEYPIKLAETITWRHRKIGVGVMGLAHLLIQLRIPYDSEEGVKTAGDVMRFIREAAEAESESLAKERSPFPDWKRSIFYSKSKHFKKKRAGSNREGEVKLRNATLLAVSPTGSTSMIAETSSGIEPIFNVSYVKKVLGGEEFYYIDPYLKSWLEEENIYSDELVERIANFGLSSVKEIPDEMKRIFVTAHEIAPEWHVRMQAAIQEHVDGAVSKTVNLPNNATLLDVENVFLLAWKLGCKGCTIYRDGSLGEQVLTVTSLLSKAHERREEARSIRDELKILANNKSLREFSG